jgi:rubrerythrin
MSPYKIRRSHRFKCKFKIKMTPEEVGLRYGDKKKFPHVHNLEVYICEHCGFIHFGHTPTW